MAGFPYAGDIGTHSYSELEAFARGSGIQFSVSSDYRPGSVTVSGNRSYHATGNAADLVTSAQSMQALAAWFEDYTPYILELIHSGGKGYFVKNGKVVSASYYGSAVVSQHYNHVHIAMTLSGLNAAKAGGSVKLVGATTYSPVADGTVQGCLKSAATTATVLVVGLAGLTWGLWDLISHCL